MTGRTHRNEQPRSDVLIPERLRQAIRSAGITQSELARRSRCSRDAVSRYCTGRTPIPDSKLVLLAHALDIRPSVIDPDKAALDGIPAAPEGHPEFLIRPLASPGKPGLVRLEITADLDIALAARIVALLTGQADSKGKEGRNALSLLKSRQQIRAQGVDPFTPGVIRQPIGVRPCGWTRLAG